MKKRILVSVVLIFINLSFFSYSQDYLQIDVTPSKLEVFKGDTARFHISLTPLNGFNASVLLNSSIGNLSQSSFNPPIEGKTCSLSVSTLFLNLGNNYISLNGKNGTTILGTATCTVSVEEVATVFPATSVEMKFNDTAIFTIQLSEYAKSLALSQGDQQLNVSTNIGIVSPEMLDITLKDSAMLSLPALDDYNIAKVLFLGNNGDTELSVLCTVTVEYEWKLYTQQNSGLPHNNIWAINFDCNNNVWIGTIGGLAKFNDTTWIIYKSSNSGLPDNFIRSITFEDDSIIWIGTHGGAAKFDNLFWTVYDSSNSDLPSNYVSSISIDTNGTKWFGTYEGVVKFDNTNWTIYNKSNSNIPSNESNTPVNCIFSFYFP